MLPKPAPRSPPANPSAAGAAALKCPRCDSANTKFCYYNNYSLSQPRHFCKSCKRYWTRGGTLRNVPVGGGTRKKGRSNKHARSSITAAAAAGIPPSVPPPPLTDIASLFYNSPAAVFLPKSDLESQFRGFEGNPQSTFHGHYSLLSSHQSMLSYDGIPIPVEESSFKRSVQWQRIRENPMETVPSDSPYFYWNQSEGGGWPAAGSSTFLT